MISTADALEIMGIVAACHPRTAPRVDDREAAMITASIWAELFAEYQFTKAELVAAVKTRAKACADAPEVADIIRVARATRNDHMARNVTTFSTSADYNETYCPGDAKAVEIADYPADWTPDKRLAIYWYAVKMKALPHTTRGWQALADQHDAETRRADA